jgi:hypothetical protein
MSDNADSQTARGIDIDGVAFRALFGAATTLRRYHATACSTWTAWNVCSRRAVG